MINFLTGTLLVLAGLVCIEAVGFSDDVLINFVTNVIGVFLIIIGCRIIDRD